jgi:hypothetical protein
MRKNRKFIYLNKRRIIDISEILSFDITNAPGYECIDITYKGGRSSSSIFYNDLELLEKDVKYLVKVLT